ncbi:glycosyltransferase family 9 protein [Rhabdochromatium marinum]|uniref:glycosyltransferase family 9 protein n=1 Tax=Rhabdochromatium marinum TaxID=48729 RepID=UPI001905AA64|nr:glycosyltransferase family 9 protein [Rhabdochromatium marinum]MBK1648821.1 lipopolysaccharide heptosyltransferase [Rhabdochromatium marinum]
MRADRAAQRILLVRLSAIGDIVFASALIDALRAAYPQAYLAWLVQPGCAPLLAHHPGLDAVIEWPHAHVRELAAARRFVALGRELVRLTKQLRGERFDLVVDLQGLLKSAVPARLTGAARRIGLDSREGSRLLMTQVLQSRRDDRRIGSEYRALAEALGLPLDKFVMRVHPGSEARGHVEPLLQQAGFTQGFVLCCPFTTRPQKHWFEERWAELAQRLRRPVGQGGVGLPVRLLGAPGDRAAAARIAQLAEAPLDAWVGETSLLLAAALIERASLLIGVDTGLSHMGIAARIPTLLLFGSTRPYLETGHANARVLYHARDCSPCRRHPSCAGRFDCMRDIDIDQVLTAAGDLVKSSAAVSRPA